MSISHVSGHWRRATVVALGLVLLAWNPMSARAEPPAATGAVPLATLDRDHRLDRIVSVDVSGITLSDLLSRVNGNGVDLTARSSCGGLKVQVKVRQPLRVLMMAVAQLLPGSWLSSGDGGYRLTMTDDAYYRRQRWWDVFNAQWNEAMASQRAAVLDGMRTLVDYSPAPGMPAAEPGDPAVEANANAQRAFFMGLSDGLQDAIAANMDTLPFYQSQIGFNDATEELSLVTPLSGLPEKLQDSVRNAIAARYPGGALPAGLDIDDADISFVNGGLAVSADVYLPNGMEFSSLFTVDPGLAPGAEAVPIDQSSLPAIVERLGNKAPSAWRELAAYQQSRVWPDDLPIAGKPEKATLGVSPILRSDWLKWLGRTAGIQYVSDYYSTPSQPMTQAQKRAPLRRPLDDELNQRAVKGDFSWKRTSDGIYLFRDNRWYRDDYLEVPTDLLNRWMATYQAPAGDSSKQAGDPASTLKKRMDLEADIVSSLSLWQVSHGLLWAAQDVQAEGGTDPTSRERVIYPFANIAPRIFWEYYTLRFYSSLTDAQRSQLVAGSLPFADLAPDQRQQALDLDPTLALHEEDAQTTYLALKPHQPAAVLVVNDGPGSLDNAPAVRLGFSADQSGGPG